MQKRYRAGEGNRGYSGTVNYFGSVRHSDGVNDLYGLASMDTKQFIGFDTLLYPSIHYHNLIQNRFPGHALNFCYNMHSVALQSLLTCRQFLTWNVPPSFTSPARN